MKSEVGFTLIEVIIALTLTGIIFGILISIYVFNIRTFQIETKRSKMQTETQTILDKIISDIKLSTEIVESFDGYYSSYDTLVLAVPAIDDSQNFLYEGDQFKKDYIIYYTKPYDNSVYKIVSADPSSSREDTTSPVELSKNTTCQFFYDPDVQEAKKVNTTLISSITLLQRNITITLSSEAKLRN